MKRRIVSFLLMLSSTVFQSFSCGIKNEDPMLRKGLLWEQYGKYKEPVIKNRFFKHSDIVPLIKKHAESNLFKDEILGNSVQGRSIHHLTMGTGKIKVLLWSQMHGDESTATMALFDLFNFFDAQDEHDALKKFILANLELHFVPMLNPDGAEVWQRRNALEIDLNRDFRRSVTPEARLLKELAQKLKPDFGFNLHDQSALYSAGPNRETATISFLAPAYNYEREMNDVRTRATQVILTMNNILQEKIQGRVAKYNDAHDPRCFGDNFQKNGISTILIESGGYPKDPEKQYIRKLNFYALVTALETIAKKTYEKENLDDYDRIPENGRALYDLVIRNVVIQKKGYEFITNLGINRSQIKSTDYRSMGYRGIIEEIGDMDRTYGYDEEEASSLTFAPGKIKSMKKEEWEKLKPEDELNLIKEGYLFITWTNGKLPAGPLKDRLLNLASNPSNVTGEAGIGKPANFLLNKNGQPVYAIVNGFLLDLNQKLQVVANTIAY